MNLGELAKIFTGITDKNKELFVLLCLIILILVIDDFHIVKSQPTPGKVLIFPTF